MLYIDDVDGYRTRTYISSRDRDGQLCCGVAATARHAINREHEIPASRLLVLSGESGFWTALACAGHDPPGLGRRRERTIRNGLSHRYVGFHGLKISAMLMIASAMSNIRLF